MAANTVKTGTVPTNRWRKWWKNKQTSARETLHFIII